VSSRLQPAPLGVSPRRLLPLLALVLGAAVVMPGADASAVGPTLEGYPTGTLQALVDIAQPGDHIQLHTGTYVGQVVINHSGTAAAPITIEPYGDGPVTLTASFPVEPCNNTKPASARTIYSTGGADYWTIQGLNIVNGIWVSGEGYDVAQPWFKNLAEIGDWQTRRALPGRGVNDRVAARNIYTALSEKLSAPMDPAEGWRLLNNDVSGRGIHGTLTRDGELGGNTIHDVACGIGPAIWLTTYSDFWKVHHNRVTSVAPSTYKHYMQEGIRLGSASAYNVVEYNSAYDLPGDGRGFTTDIDASWNIFRYNSAARAQMGYNDQQSGWGNQWVYNTADAMRGTGFAFRGLDASLTAPSMNSTTYRSYVKCNQVTNSYRALTAGGLNQTRFVNNTFPRIALSVNLRSYWAAYGNTWNGSTTPPPNYPKPPAAGAC